jgi:hypothetical protein
MFFKDPHSDHLGGDASIYVALKQLLVLAILLLPTLSFSQKLQEFKSDKVYFQSEVIKINGDMKVQVIYIKAGKEQKITIPFNEVTDRFTDKKFIVWTCYPTGLKTIIIERDIRNPNVVINVSEI